MPPLIHEQTTNLLTANSNPQQFEECSTRIKCVLVGDGAIGKTSLVVSYTTNGYPTEYVPTAFDNYNVMVTVDNQPTRFQLCDTAGQDDFDSLRPLCYPGTDVFLLCFSVVSPTSFYNVRDKWLPEIRHHCPGAPVVLVGTQCDLRSDVKVLIELNSYREHPVHEKQARRLAQQIGAVSYLECSALTQKNLKEVFDTAILVTLQKKKQQQKRTEKAARGQQQQLASGQSVSRHNNQYSPAAAIAKENGSCRSRFYANRLEAEVVRKDKSNTGWKKLCCFS